MNDKRITLDLAKPDGPRQAVRVRRGDRNGTALAATVLDSGLPADLGGATVALVAATPAGAVEVACDVADSVASCVLDEAGFPAGARAWLRVEVGGRAYSTEDFRIETVEGDES